MKVRNGIAGAAAIVSSLDDEDLALILEVAIVRLVDDRGPQTAGILVAQWLAEAEAAVREAPPPGARA